jgi:hypothetical protein
MPEPNIFFLIRISFSYRDNEIIILIIEALESRGIIYRLSRKFIQRLNIKLAGNVARRIKNPMGHKNAICRCPLDEQSYFNNGFSLALISLYHVRTKSGKVNNSHCENIFYPLFSKVRLESQPTKYN